MRVLCGLAGLCAGLVLAGCGSGAVRPRVTGRLVLDRDRVHTGQAVTGSLVFDSRTAKTVVLLSGCRIDGLFAVGFRNSDGQLQAPGFSAVGCNPEQHLVAKPGRTVYRFKVRVTYMGCTQSAANQLPKTSQYWTPLCLKDSAGERDVMPPLPTGRYTAVFVPAGKWAGPRVAGAKLSVTGHG